jgi:hypothetical protein
MSSFASLQIAYYLNVEIRVVGYSNCKLVFGQVDRKESIISS